MSYCYDFFKKFKQEGNFCDLADSEVSRLNSYLEIVELLMKQKIPEKQIYENFTVKAARPLLSAKDRTAGLNYVVACLKRGKKITTGDLQSSLGVFEKRSPVGRPVKKLDKSNPKHVGAEVKELDKSNSLVEKKPETKPVLPVEKPVVKEPLTVPPAAPIAPILKEKYAPVQQPAPTVTQPLTAQPAPDIPWHCGVAPCPDGQDHIEVQNIPGKVCELLSLPCNQLKKERCPILIRQAKAQAEGFVPASDIDPVTGGRFVKLAPVRIVKSPEVITWTPSQIQWDYINRALDSGKFDTPQQVLSQALDLWMAQEGQ